MFIPAPDQAEDGEFRYSRKTESTGASPMGQMLVMFVTIFVAELGDKTQLATILFASEDKNSPQQVFLASAGALVLGAAISTLLGTAAGRWFEHIPLRLIAGICFLAIGAGSIVSHFRAA